MDFFLFQKYGLNQNETNLSVIESALEKYRTEQDWDSKLKSKNDRIRSKAKDEHLRWTEDKEILSNDNKRNNYLEEYRTAVESIVEYILDNEDNENAFEEIAAIQGIDAETAKILYENNKDIFSNNNPDLDDVFELAFCINKIQNSYNALLSKVDENIKNKFFERNIDLSALYNALHLDKCYSGKDIEVKAQEVSLIAYELYNNQLFSSDIKNTIMDIFDPKSTKSDAIISFTNNVNLEKYLKAEKWILIKYIRNTCILMKKSGKISEQKIINIPKSDRRAFAKAMKAVFNVIIEVSSSGNENNDDKNELPEELHRAETALAACEFEKAIQLFKKASDKAPYCWQAYWGMFKASIQASSDDDIYFPGFLEALRNSESDNSLPTYFDYYKTAKYYAVAQKSSDINFVNIETEYKKADEIYATHLGNIEILQNLYESGQPEKIPSKRGKEAAINLLNKIADVEKKSTYSLINIAFAYFGIFLLALAASNSDISFIGDTGIDTVAGIIIILQIIIAGVVVWLRTYSIMVTALVSLGLFAVTMLIAVGLYSYAVLGVILSALFAVLGGYFASLGFKKLLVTRNMRKNMAKTEAEINRLASILYNALTDEIRKLYNDPNIIKYGIPAIEDIEIKFDLSNYHQNFSNKEIE